jgi:hypothetical protein
MIQHQYLSVKYIYMLIINTLITFPNKGKMDSIQDFTVHEIDFDIHFV